jgi:hypothetical protein
VVRGGPPGAPLIPAVGMSGRCLYLNSPVSGGPHTVPFDPTHSKTANVWGTRPKSCFRRRINAATNSRFSRKGSRWNSRSVATNAV